MEGGRAETKQSAQKPVIVMVRQADLLTLGTLCLFFVPSLHSSGLGPDLFCIRVLVHTKEDNTTLIL